MSAVVEEGKAPPTRRNQGTRKECGGELKTHFQRGAVEAAVAFVFSPSAS